MSLFSIIMTWYVFDLIVHSQSSKSAGAKDAWNERLFLAIELPVIVTVRSVAGFWIRFLLACLGMCIRVSVNSSVYRKVRK